MTQSRSAGVLCAISSLPSQYGIGCFDEAAYAFVDWLIAAKQRVWQILPLGHTSLSASPYKCYSAFAGNPYYIDLQPFVDRGILSAAECARCCGSSSTYVNYKLLFESRMELLFKAYQASNVLVNSPEFHAFITERAWVLPYAQFMALKSLLNGAKLNTWPDELKTYGSQAVRERLDELADVVRFYQFVQFVFFQQWHKLKAYANKRGVTILGDMPIYVSDDSADLWANPELFQVEANGSLANVAGCPPDAFSKDGQVWGNPLYRWPVHARDNFRWWTERMRAGFELFDSIRIDHFRGFESYFAIDAASQNAQAGHWEEGPGTALFSALSQSLGPHDIIVEDLGTITDAVRELVRTCGFPNMRVLEFGFDARNKGDRTFHLPHAYPANCVAYTGTHDNETLQEWLRTICAAEHKLVRDYLCDETTPEHDLNDALIALIMRSRAKLTIVPLQDWLGLGKEARMNTPATVGGKNWAWRVDATQLSDELASKIARMTSEFGRE